MQLDEPVASTSKKRIRDDEIPEEDEEEEPSPKKKKLSPKKQKELAKKKAELDDELAELGDAAALPKGRYANRTPGAFNHCAECGNREAPHWERYASLIVSRLYIYQIYCNKHRW